MAFGPDGEELLGTDRGAILRGADREAFSSQAGPVVDLAAGQRLLASVTERTVRLHDLATGEWVGEPLPTGRAGPVQFSPDGLLMTRSDAGVVAWDLDTRSWPDKACRAAGRRLTEGEWGQYLPGRPYRPACRP